MKRLEIELVKKSDMEAINEKLINLEDRSRRNNLRIDGIVENENETWSDTQKKAEELFGKILGVENVDVERAHRSGKKQAGKPRSIVLKLLNWKDKQKILLNCHKLKGRKIYVYEDFSRETMEKRKMLWNKVKDLRRQGKFAIISYNRIIQRDPQ